MRYVIAINTRQKVILISLALPALFLIGLIVLRNDKPAPLVKDVDKREKFERKDETILVDIGGAVQRPGVYEFHEKERIIDAVKRAGGVLQKADLDQINQAAKLEDGQKILIPWKAVQNEGAPSVPAESQLQNSVDGKINLNTASVEQLDSIDGIGPVLAERIVEFRKKNGWFKSVDQLNEVEGIGQKKFERLKDSVTL